MLHASSERASNKPAEIPNNVFETIKKLLALGERGGTEAESASAMEKAYQLLAKYNLSMADIKQSEAVYETSETKESHNGVWERLLYSGITQLYFGKYLLSRTKNGSFHMVIARPENLAMIHHVAQYLIRTGKSLASQSAEHHPQENRISHMTAFCKGYGIRILQRCQERIATARAEGLPAEKCTALTVTHYYDQEASGIGNYLQEQNIRVRHASTKQTFTSRRGFEAGKNAGEAANLNTNSAIR